MNAAQLIQQTSGSVEFYTPGHITDAARAVMGGIDLDPASNDHANRWIKATKIYIKQDNGLSHHWFGRVWMNHPFGRGANKQWIDKLVYGYEDGDITEACCITYACTSEAWFQPLFGYAQCWISPRLNYVDAHGYTVRGVTKGSVVTYLGAKRHLFARVFAPIGRVTVAYGAVRPGQMGLFSGEMKSADSL